MKNFFNRNFILEADDNGLIFGVSWRVLWFIAVGALLYVLCA